MLAAFAVVLPASVQAARSWTIVPKPDELVVDVATPIDLTVTNTSSSGSGMTCIEVKLPGGFEASGAAVVSVNGQSGDSLLGWTTVWPGGSTVVFKSTLGDGALGEGDQAVFRITGTATTSGPMSWTAVAYDTPGLPLLASCGSNAYPTLTIAFSVVPGPTSAPTPTPAPTARPTPTPSPRPSLIVLPTLPIQSLPPILPLPTASPVATPLPTPGRSAEPTPTDRPAQGASGVPTEPPAPSGSGRGSASPAPGGGLVIPGDRGPKDPIGGLDDVAFGTLNGFDGGLAAWAYPVFIVSVPGLLLLLAVAAQAIGAFAWLPVIRRRLGTFELRRARDDR